jgi:cell division protein ZapA
MSGKDNSSLVRVTIFGEEYQIRTDLDKDYTLGCAKYVDDAIQEAHVRGHIAEPHRAAILAALKITDELFKSRGDVDELNEVIQTRIAEFSEQLETVAKGADLSSPEPIELTLDM